MDVWKSLSVTFQINTQLFFFKFLTKWLPSAILDVRNHFGSHFWPFLINTDFFFFYKMAAGGHFGCPKITFDLISIHFTSIRNFNFFWNFLTKWLTSAILDVRISLSISFLAISDRYATLIFFGNFWQNGWRRLFWMSEIHFRSHFWQFQIDRPFCSRKTNNQQLNKMFGI